MECIDAPFGGLMLLKARRIDDDRGYFSETYNQRDLDRLGIKVEFCQDNHAFSKHVGTLRGMHFQAPPHSQAKLIRCTKGAIREIAIDIRRGSPTYGQHFSADLTPDNHLQLFVPDGFANGYCTLEDMSEVQYKVSNFYNKDSEGGLSATDEALNLNWPDYKFRMSVKDQGLPRFGEFVSPFHFDGMQQE